MKVPGVAMGVVFATLKCVVTPPQGLERLKVHAQLLRHYPIVAIGGIDLKLIPAVLASGVGSVGVVRALVAAAEAQTAVDEFLGQMCTQ